MTNTAEHTARTVARLILTLAVVGTSTRFGLAQDTAGDTPVALTWRQFVDGHEEEWPISRPDSVKDVDATVGRLLQWHREAGFYEAVVDSVAIDSTRASVYIVRGTQFEVGKVIVTGAKQFAPEQLVAEMDTRTGRVLTPAALERDLARILERYEQRGFVLASAQVVRLAPQDDDPSLLQIAIHIDEGPLMTLSAVEIEGGKRTTTAFIQRATGLKVGKPLSGFDPEEIEARLEATGLFSQIDSVRLGVNGDNQAVLKVALLEQPPGAFDAIIGFLPNTGRDGGGTVVGDVTILLKHVLGGGRSFDFRFRRNPGSVTRVNVMAEDPFIFGLPIRLAGRFDGFQQDSTFDTRGYGIEGGYRIQRLELFANATWEDTRPGSAESSTVPTSDAWFGGIGFSYRVLDSRVSPRKGFEVLSNVENGRKQRETTREVDGGGTERVLETAYQQRLRGMGRVYMPIKRRHVAVLGVDTQAIQSRTYDDADLIRFGGAKSMRGYNEDQFRGNLTGRFLSEWRYLIDRSSFLFAFLDVGYVNLPEINTVTAPERVAQEWLTGYGVGLQLETEAGLFTMSLAFNSDEGLEAKVHVGMTLGL